MPVVYGSATSETPRWDSVPPGVWAPHNEYDDVSIGVLAPGPRRLSLTARVVNVYDQSMNCKTPRAAKGCLKVLIKDGSGSLLAGDLLHMRYDRS